MDQQQNGQRQEGPQQNGRHHKVVYPSERSRRNPSRSVAEEIGKVYPSPRRLL